MQKIVVLGTGGTIAGVPDEAAQGDGRYRAGVMPVQKLTEEVTRWAPEYTATVLTEQVAQMDSKDMDHATWARLAARARHWLSDPQVQGVVVTHGTDTLEETAFFLHLALPAALLEAKPVVLTCAMRPAGSAQSDGPQNLLDALNLVRGGAARGVLAVCAGVIHGALDVRKVHPFRLDAFSSGDAGPIGRLEAGMLRQFRNWPAGGCAAPPELPEEPARWPRVEIVMSHAGAGASVIDALVAQRVDGLVVAATGNATVHQELEQGLRRAAQAGVALLRASRCPEGATWPGSDSVAPGAGVLSPVKARIALLLRLLGAEL